MLTANSLFSDGRCAVKAHGIRFGRRRLYVIDRPNAQPFRRYAPLPQESPRQEVELLLVAPDTWVDSAHLDAYFQYDTLLHRPQKAWVSGLE